MGSRPQPASGSLAKLRARQRELAQRVAELTWDLGGLTYEMAIRDHYRLDVLARRAAELQEADAQLNEVQRLLASSEAGVHGQCSSCGAVHSRGAAYCWQCGAPLLSEARPAVLAAGSAGSNGSNGSAGANRSAGSNGSYGTDDSHGANDVGSANDAFGVGGA